MRSSFHSLPSGTLGWLVLVLAIFVLRSPGDIQAQQEPTQRKQTAAPQEMPPLRNPPVIEIQVQTSAKQIVPGDTVGVFADITNKSMAQVYLRHRDVQFLFAFETEKRLCSSDGWFPNVTREGKEKDVLCLKRGETSRVFMAPSEYCGSGRWYQRFRFINFAPGTYPITVDAKYWEQENFSGDDYHTAVGTTTAEYAAPRSIILVGAILGGIIFTFISLVRAEQRALDGSLTGRPNMARTFGKIENLLALGGSVLLSVIITILLSRVEQAQSFIRVNVSDFWGAIAVGFLANYGGWALLDKMVGGAGKDKSKKQTQITS